MFKFLEKQGEKTEPLKKLWKVESIWGFPGIQSHFQFTTKC